VSDDTPVDRFLRRKTEDLREAGPELSQQALQRQRSLEGYFDAGVPPRWMERLAEIERLKRRARRDLAELHRALEGRPDLAERWRALAEAWDFAAVNELIRQHNDWFPIERRLAVDLRTRDYVLIHGRPYRKPELGPDWILEQFPPE
jgi:hypothetical protein